MNYENMTDFEINKAVASELGIYWHSSPSNNNSNSWVYSDNYNECNASKGGVAIELPDYCNNPSNAWPIIIENKISIMNDDDMWEASIDFDGDLGEHGADEVLTRYYEHKNPLRAAMIVYLMMNEDK